MVFRQYDGSQLAYVFYSAVNKRDLTFATGKIQNYWTSPIPTDPDLPIGCEFSGLTCGRRVMGIVEFGSIGLQVQTDPYYTWEIPESWSLEDATTVPLLYAIVRTV